VNLLVALDTMTPGHHDTSELQHGSARAAVSFKIASDLLLSDSQGSA
jgi:hypothetical protein